MRLKVNKMKGGEDKLTKLDVIQDNPVIQEALVKFAAEQKGSGMRMKGSGWWSDFVSWLKRNKVISIATKIGGAIAGAVGALPLATALGAISTGSSALGYGYVNNLSQVGTGMVFNRSGFIQNQKTTRMKGGAVNFTSAAMPTTTTYGAVYSSSSGKRKM